MQAGNELSNIHPKSLHARKKPTTTTTVLLTGRFRLLCDTDVKSPNNHCSIHFKSGSITDEASFAISCHEKTSGHFSDSCFCVLRKKMFANTILKYYSQTIFLKGSYIKNHLRPV